MDNEQPTHNNKLTNTDFQLILFNFLSLHGDAIFDIIYKKQLLSFLKVNDQIQIKDIEDLMLNLDMILSKLVLKFNSESVVMHRKNFDKQKTKSKKKTPYKKLSKFLYGYQPSLSYLFAYTDVMEMGSVVETIITPPDLTPINTTSYLKFRFAALEDKWKFRLYLDNTQSRYDTSDRTDVLPNTFFTQEFEFLLNFFKQWLLLPVSVELVDQVSLINLWEQCSSDDLLIISKDFIFKGELHSWWFLIVCYIKKSNQNYKFVFKKNSLFLDKTLSSIAFK